ncbi:MAG: hypothetical protein ACK4VP_05360 [Nitrospira sp.]
MTNLSSKQDTPGSKRPSGLHQFVEQAPKALAGMAALTIIAYGEGALYTRAYLSEFGALWLLDSIPMAVFFEHSVLPLLILLFLVLLAVRGLFDRDQTDLARIQKRFTVSLTTIIYGPWCLAGLSLLDFVLDHLGYNTVALIFSATAVLVLLLFIASALDYALVRWQRPDLRLHGVLFYPALAAMVVSLYLVPSQLGRNFGKFDKNPATSSLLTIRLYHETSEYKLLFSTDGLVYIFPIHFEGDFPPIQTVSASQVEAIARGRFADELLDR